MVAAAGVKSGATVWARVPAIQILPDRQLTPAHAAQRTRLIPLRLRPHFRGMAGQCIVAFPARVIFPAALHPDRNHIPWGFVMRAARLCIQFDAKNPRPSHMKYDLMEEEFLMKGVSVDWVVCHHCLRRNRACPDRHPAGFAKWGTRAGSLSARKLNSRSCHRTVRIDTVGSPRVSATSGKITAKGQVTLCPQS